MRKNNKISKDNLILFCVFSINEKKEKCSFEKLVKECFSCFPQVFSLGSYPWPDSRKLDRPLRYLKNKNFLNINFKKEFSLTKKGIKKAEEVINILRQTKLKI